MRNRFLKAVLSFAAIGMGLAVAACDGEVTFNGVDGVPLSELDMTGAAPTDIALASPDKVIVTEGDALAIKVSGDAAASEALRFTVEDGTLGIAREKSDKSEGKAVIAVTMPPLHQILMAGSGHIEAPQLVDKAEVNLAGSGKVKIAKVAAKAMNVNVMGSGTLETGGTAEHLNLNLAGSGNLLARRLKVGTAEINIAGSGGGEFASDGKVEARVAGSGVVTVHGRADCKISSLGSGRLNCRPDAGDADAAPTAPEAPARPVAPSAPPAPPKPE